MWDKSRFSEILSNILFLRRVDYSSLFISMRSWYNSIVHQWIRQYSACFFRHLIEFWIVEKIHRLLYVCVSRYVVLRNQTIWFKSVILSSVLQVSRLSIDLTASSEYWHSIQWWISLHTINVWLFLMLSTDLDIFFFDIIISLDFISEFTFISTRMLSLLKYLHEYCFSFSQWCINR